MIILTLNLPDRRVEVEDLATGRTRSRHLDAGALFRLLRNLIQSGRYARIHNNDSAQIYQFAPVMIYRPKGGALRGVCRGGGQTNEVRH